MFETATLVYKFRHTGFPRYFAPYLSSYSSSYHTRCSQSGGNFLVIPKFYPSVHNSVKQFGNSFALMPPLCGMLFQMKFVPLPPWALSDSSSKPACMPKNTHLSQDHPLVFSMVLDPSYASGYWNFVDCFLFCCALESSCVGRLSATKVQLELNIFL